MEQHYPLIALHIREKLPKLYSAKHNRYDRKRYDDYVAIFNYNDDKQLEAFYSHYVGHDDHYEYHYVGDTPLKNIDNLDFGHRSAINSSINIIAYRDTFDVERTVDIKYSKPIESNSNGQPSNTKLLRLNNPFGSSVQHSNGSIRFSLSAANYHSNKDDIGYVIGDFDGDGLDDTLGRTSNGYSEGRFTSSKTHMWKGAEGTTVADVNGDGLQEVIPVPNDGGVYLGVGTDHPPVARNLSIRISNGIDEFVEIAAVTRLWGKNLAVGDVNGDQIPDYLNFYDKTYYEDEGFKIHHIVGNDVATSPSFSLPNYSHNKDNTYIVTDLNGDGRGDIVVFRWFPDSSSKTYLKVFLNNGNYEFIQSHNFSRKGKSAAYVGDLDRDGLAEIILRDEDRGNVYDDERLYVTDMLPDMLISAIEPSGSKQSISYSLYKGEEDNWFPYPRNVVKTIYTLDGKGN
ncbi:FG-GAP repeat domain-containing protein, partial [Pseudovibrio denitrificans]|uniref:FG-GAP repeat domain-containing protein n=1 Tax=Pseudovibrio denitrificans TaxID=258256 RepID=UPI000A9F7A7F